MTAFAALFEDVERSGCRPCLGSLTLFGVRRWPLGDDRLLAMARTALDEGGPDLALIYLSEVHDRATPDWAELQRRARAALRP